MVITYVVTSTSAIRFFCLFISLPAMGMGYPKLVLLEVLGKWLWLFRDLTENTSCKDHQERHSDPCMQTSFEDGQLSIIQTAFPNNLVGPCVPYYVTRRTVKSLGTADMRRQLIYLIVQRLSPSSQTTRNSVAKKGSGYRHRFPVLPS